MNSRVFRSVSLSVAAFGIVAATACSSSPRSSESFSSLAPSEQAAGGGAAKSTVTLPLGPLSQLAGKCPNVKFLLGSAKVEASARTTYPTGSCETLVFAQRVDVTGSLNGNTLTASSIKQLKNKDGL